MPDPVSAAITGVGTIAGIDSKKDAEKRLNMSQKQFQELIDFQKSLVTNNVFASTPGFNLSITRTPTKPTQAPSADQATQGQPVAPTTQPRAKQGGVDIDSPQNQLPAPAGNQAGGGEDETFGSDQIISLQNTGPWRGIILDATGQIDAAIDKLGRVVPGFLLDRRQLMELADQTAGLQSSVEPGFSQFREAGLNQIETARQAATSNLADEFARRRIAGSSFAADALSRTEAEFAQQKANFEAQSFLAELDATMKLIEQEADLTVAATNELINIANVRTTQGNLASAKGQLALGAQQADIAALQTALGASADMQQFLIQSSQLMQQNAQIQQQIAAEEAAGAGSFLGDVFGTVANGVASSPSTSSGFGGDNVVPVATGSAPVFGVF